MFGKRKVIDAQAELAKIDGERDPDQLQRQRRHVPGMKAFMVLVVVLAMGLTGFVFYVSMGRAQKEQAAPPGQIRNLLPELRLADIEPPAPPPVPEAPVEVTPPPAPVVHVAAIATPMPTPDPAALAVRQRRLTSGLQGSAGPSAGQTTGTEDYLAAIRAMPGEGAGGPEFARQLQPLRTQPSVATRLQNRSYLLTQGSTIDCVLLSRLVSTQAGMVTCQVPSDIYGSDGSTVVLDRGTRLTGYQQGGLSQGQARIFVVWSRAQTPGGVVISLDSPGTGPLGESGLGGYVDSHFWERFQGAVFVSLLGDLGQWVSNRSRSGDGMQFNNTTSGAQDAISTVLERTVDIPPTLYKNQGELVAVTVARDLDFSSVYARLESP